MSSPKRFFESFSPARHCSCRKEACRMEFELGQTYAGYKFLDVAQRSVSGVEYRVRNTPAERTELLKVLPPCVRANREETERFLREMPVLAELVHPNIVTFFTAMPLEGRLVMTTELVEGLPLSERLQLGPIDRKSTRLNSSHLGISY